MSEHIEEEVEAEVEALLGDLEKYDDLEEMLDGVAGDVDLDDLDAAGAFED